MAWERVIFNRLYYKWNGVEHPIDGSKLPPMVLSSFSELINRANTDYRLDYTPTWNSWSSTPSAANENYRAVGALDGGNGLNWDYFLGAMSNGQKLYIYKESGNDSIALIFHKYSDAIRLGVKWYGIEQTFSYSIPRMANCTYRAGYEEYAITERTCNMGFLHNTDTNQYTVYWVGLSGVKGSDIYYMSNYYTLFMKPYANDLTGILTYLFTGNVPPTSSDPYAPVGPSETTPSSTGTFDAESDAIALPSVPTLSAQSGGLITLYTIDAANMATFANFLLSGGFNDATLKKLFSSPMEAILCLNYFPYTPPTAGAATEISIGQAATGANGYLLTEQYDTVTCGTVDIDEYYGSCLDMSPYTSITLVLPYCGAVELDPDEFMGKTVGVTYYIDCYTGACLALITADDVVMLQVQGMMANPLPIMASNYNAVATAIAQLAVTAGVAVATVVTGGASTPAAIAIAGGVAASGVGAVMNAKVHYNHGGSGGMGTGLFGVQKPYLIIKRPRACVPDNNGNFQGYPTFVSLVLGNCSGYTKISEIHLDDISATDGEKKELEAILKGGVWF